MDCSLLGVQMAGGQQHPQRKMLQWQLTEDPGQKQSSPVGLSAASGQPDPESSPQENVQTQDWSPKDIAKMVEELVSEDVDKDVLFPHQLRPAESSTASRDFMAGSAHFWQNSDFEASTSRSPPS